MGRDGTIVGTLLIGLMHAHGYWVLEDLTYMQFSSDAGLGAGSFRCVCVFGNLAVGSDTQGRGILFTRIACGMFVKHIWERSVRWVLGFRTLTVGNTVMIYGVQLRSIDQ